MSFRFAMKGILPLLIGGSLLGCARALSENPSTTVSALSTLEQYCFPRSGGPFSAASIWPSVTMIYDGVTLTTTPITITMSVVTPNIASTIGTSDISISASSPVVSGIADDNSGPSPTETLASSKLRVTASDGPIGSQNVPSIRSGGKTPSQSTGVASPVPITNSGAATGNPVTATGSENNLATASTMTTMNRNTADTTRSMITVRTDTLSMSPIGVSITHSTLDTVRTTTTDSKTPAATGISGASSLNSSFTAIVSGINPSRTNEQIQASISASPSSPAISPSDRAPNALNATLDLSPAAVDSLQLAQFLKNLGVSVFNSSNLNARLPVEGDTHASSLSDLVANISVVRPVISSSFFDRQQLTCATNAARANAAEDLAEFAPPHR